MVQKFYISDLHLGHKNCISFDERPFKTLEEMTETIIRRWNNAVDNKDEVYILGDMFWKNVEAVDILRRLNGQLHLVKENHDKPNAEMTKYFVCVKDYAEIKDNDRNIVLCHYPIAHWRNADYGYIHLYGHILTGRDAIPFEEYASLMKNRGTPYECFNVGCMLPYMDYTPRTLDEIIAANANKE